MNLQKIIYKEKKPILLIKQSGFNQFFYSILGPLGYFEKYINLDAIPMAIFNKEFLVNFFFNTKQAYTIHRNIFFNLFYDLATGYFLEFIIRGIGYRYKFYKRLNKYNLVFKIGYSHKIFFELPNIKLFNFFGNKRFDFFVFSFSKSVLSMISENIRQIKVTDPYKGKGIKQYNLPLRLKVGKIR
jgi:ribosomal protein L6P/L9E